MIGLTFGVLTVLSFIGACAEPDQRPVHTAAERREVPASAPRVSAPAGRATRPVDAPIATVNDRPMTRSSLFNPLLRSHGLALFEQLVVLDQAEALAVQRKLEVSPRDIDRERELTLARMLNPLASVTPQSYDSVEARRALEAVLAQRNLSHEEFDLLLRRNALLRRIVEADMTVSDEQLKREFDRLYGERVIVSHIQVGSAPEAARIQERLTAGEDFAELARRYSANQPSAKDGGRLEPFSMSDDRVPELFRQTALSLQPGQLSPVVRIGEWFHLIRCEQRLAPESRQVNEVQVELTRRVREREAEPAMFSLYEKLFKEARITIDDPVLREAFEAKHGRR